MGKMDLTTITVFRKDKDRFDDFFEEYNKILRENSDIPKELFKPKQKTEVFQKIMDIIEGKD